MERQPFSDEREPREEHALPPAADCSPAGDKEFRQYGEIPRHDDDTENPYRAESDLAKRKTHAFSVVSLVTGIFSILCCCSAYGGLVLGVCAIVFAIVSRRHLGYFEGMALAGLVCGIMGTLFSLLIILLSVGVDWDEILRRWKQEFPDAFPKGNGAGDI